MSFNIQMPISIVVFMLIAHIAVADTSKGELLSGTCVACHNVDGNSTNPIWPKLAGQHKSYTIKQLQDFKAGRRVNTQMAAIVSALTEEDMAHLADYYASQQLKIGTADPKFIELGEKIYRVGDHKSGVPSCMSCHGPSGSGNPAAVYPLLSGQHAAYTEAQLRMFKAEERNNDVGGIMRTIAGRMTNAQIKAVAEYIQGLH